MSGMIEGRCGELLRLGLASRNWIILQMGDDEDLLKLIPRGFEKSASEIVSHIAWTVSVVIIQIAGQLNIEVHIDEPVTTGNENQFVSEIKSAYDLFKQLCSLMTDDMLDKIASLPSPARIKEGSVDTILRTIGGYHTIHHAGQIAMLLSRAKREE